MKKLSIIACFLILLACSTGRQSLSDDEREKGTPTLTESGELQAVNSKIVQMPSFNWAYGRPKIVRLETEGINVVKGDIVDQLLSKSGVSS